MRPIVLGNQRMLVNIDERLSVRDIYWKRVGQENHVLGRAHKIGVWADYTLTWLDDNGWNITSRRDEDGGTYSVARHEGRDITITFHDIVLKDQDVLLRRITSNRHVRLFMYQYFFLYGDGIGDTACYDIERKIIVHYKRNRYFGVGAYVDGESVLADYTVSAPDHGADAWRDAYDGELARNAIAQGNVDSCIAFNVLEGQTVDYLLIAARDFTAMRSIATSLQHANRTELIMKTLEAEREFTKPPASVTSRSDIPDSWKRLYEISLSLIKMHTDEGGAITAANDSDNMLFNRDTYSYVWGRDGALVAHALSLAGKHNLARSFFEFMEPRIEPGGYYLHKHHPNGSLGSSWHAWERDGKPYLPIQEDSTALIVWALEHYHHTANDDFAARRESWISSMSNFLVKHVRDDVILPHDTWDLWEERQGIHTWTLSSVIAGLRAGASFAERQDDADRARRYRQLADAFTESLVTMCVAKPEGRLVRRLSPTLEQDWTIDAADIAPFLFGVLPADHPAIVATVKAIETNLKTPSGGIARYERDYFHRKTEEAAGNAWIICTLWVAQWHLASGNEEEARTYIEWVVARATPTGMLPEQVHPITNEVYSVCPLTWSHATFIEIVHTYIDHVKQK